MSDAKDTPTSPITPPRPRLRSVDLSEHEPLSDSALTRLSKQLLEQIESLEASAAKRDDVRELGAQIDALRSQTGERDVALFTELSTLKTQGQKAAAGLGTTAFGMRFLSISVGALTLLGALGTELGKGQQTGAAAVLIALAAALAKVGPQLARLAGRHDEPPGGQGP